MTLATCVHPLGTRRRIFWATQPDACDTFIDNCGVQCGKPGLVFVYGDQCAGLRCACDCPGPAHNPDCIVDYQATRNAEGASISNENWIRGLLLNIFNTVARAPASDCGVQPGSQGGHWTESYNELNTYIGSTMYVASGQTVTSIRDAIKIINAAITRDAQKLVTYGVATSVTVETEYKGSNRMSATISVRGANSITGVVNLNATRINNAWVWA